MTLNEAKLLLKVDYDEEDKIIEQMIRGIDVYLYNAIGKLERYSILDYDLPTVVNKVYFEEFELPLVELYKNALLVEMFENRGLTCQQADNKIRHIYSSILSQLKYR